jgi:hypothetical protein
MGVNCPTMNMRFIKIILPFSIFLSQIIIVGLCPAQDPNNVFSNENYVIWVEDNSILGIYDIEKGTIEKKTFEHKIEYLDICPSYPFATLGFNIPHDKYDEKQYSIFDLETKKNHTIKLIFNPFSKIWSPSGEFTVINDNDEELMVLETSKLRKYLGSHKSNDAVALIKGHPLGLIALERWIGDCFIYNSGCCESSCTGFFDTLKKKNYFLSCCFSCDVSKITFSSELQQLVNKLQSKTLPEISFDFYNEVSRLTSTKNE